MALISMKTSEDNDVPEEIRSNPYGYGLEIRLNEDQCEALGITTPPTPGSKVMVKAATIVTEVRQSVEADGDDAGPDTYLCLQITDLELGGAESNSSSASMLYGD
jgi:hypothetical protein